MEARHEALIPLYENDKKNGYRYGTTFDIIWGTFAAFGILVSAGLYAVQQGWIKLPF